MKQNKKILVFGATGMLGSAIYNYISLSGEFEVVGTYRPGATTDGLIENGTSKLARCDLGRSASDATDLIERVTPAAVINCVGVIKQRSEASEVLATVPINTILPHQLHAACQSVGAKFIHFSTDCVFSGSKGSYTEEDKPDAIDVYGLSKYLGEVSADGALTLRTSIIGHELHTNRSLLNWFLSQDNKVMGFTNAYFSGLPTSEVARVTLEILKYHYDSSGLYHLASERISKYDLLSLINKIYEKKLVIVPDGQLNLDRSLNADKLSAQIGYVARPWDQLIGEMKDFKDVFK